MEEVAVGEATQEPMQCDFSILDDPWKNEDSKPLFIKNTGKWYNVYRYDHGQSDPNKPNLDRLSSLVFTQVVYELRNTPMPQESGSVEKEYHALLQVFPRKFIDAWLSEHDSFLDSDDKGIQRFREGYEIYTRQYNQ